PFEDEYVARVCANNLEHKGVTVHRHCRLVSMHVVSGQVEHVVEEPGGGRGTIRVDAALVSIGRVPNTLGLGLESIGVKLTPTGYIVNDDTCTTLPHIYAAGDVTDDIALGNVGEIGGRPPAGA